MANAQAVVREGGPAESAITDDDQRETAEGLAMGEGPK